MFDALFQSGERITAAIRAASQSTGIQFDYLFKTAVRESALNPRAAAMTSSARGLFQFIDTTWLMTVKEDGPAFGLHNEANAIEKTADGRYIVRDPQVRASILKLRENPEIASVMAAAFSRRNAAEIQGVLGRQPTGGELYIAHFLGANGAKRFLSLRASEPTAVAASLFPDAARANRSIFYGPSGPRSVEGVYRVLVAKHDNVAPAAVAAAAPPAHTQVAGKASPDGVSIPQLFNRLFGVLPPAPAVPPPEAIPARPGIVASAAPQRAVRVPVRSANVTAAPPPPVRGVVQIPPQMQAIAAPPPVPAPRPDGAPIFRGLFQTADATPISADVRSLWGGINPMGRP
jgi:hypothetical protein